MFSQYNFITCRHRKNTNHMEQREAVSLNRMFSKCSVVLFFKSLMDDLSFHFGETALVLAEQILPSCDTIKLLSVRWLLCSFNPIYWALPVSARTSDLIQSCDRMSEAGRLASLTCSSVSPHNSHFWGTITCNLQIWYTFHHKVLVWEKDG